MKTWDQFLPDILPHCSAAPSMVAEDQARNAAETFLTDSRAWRVWLSITTDDTKTEYTPALPTGTQMVKLHAAKLDGVPMDLEPTTPGETGAAWKVWTDLTTITAGPAAPGAGKTLAVQVSLTVTPDSVGLDDAMFNRYRQGIAHGAIAMVCAASDKPYSNPAKAGEYEGKFRAVIDKARAEKARGNSSAPVRVTGHFF
jgi:hypothetical protein